MFPSVDFAGSPEIFICLAFRHRVVFHFQGREMQVLPFSVYPTEDFKEIWLSVIGRHQEKRRPCFMKVAKIAILPLSKNCLPILHQKPGPSNVICIPAIFR
jgi:hypothetical protein